MENSNFSDSIRSVTEALGENETAIEAIKAIEHLQVNPEAKIEAISSIVEKTEQTRCEALKQLSTIVHSMAETEAVEARVAKEKDDKDKKKK